ncbi:hypothetical protein [Thalassoporum mexicanum]|uniref:hypothetical protein n=1 Tax=Thalassoporum mexicanum TaxID=3457544 RepID=UPI0003122702|nr:hypothetical protein [Pseudanabaena sp. PCC 7367]
MRRFYNGFWIEVRQLPNYLIRDITTIARIATLRIVSATFYPIAKLGAIAKTKLLPASNSSGSKGSDLSIDQATHNLDSATELDRTNSSRNGQNAHQNGQIAPNDYFQQIWQHGQTQLPSQLNSDANSSNLVTTNGNGSGKITHHPSQVNQDKQSPGLNNGQSAFLITAANFSQLNPWQKLVLRLGYWVERTYILAEVELGITVLSELSATELVTLNQPNPIEQDDYRDRHRLNLINWRDRFLDLIPQLQPDQQGLANRSDQLDNSNHNSEHYSVDYVRNLIKAAIAYFFSRKSIARQIDASKSSKKDQQSPSALPANNSSQANNSDAQEQPWLTMAELFGDDNSHWPPLRHQRTTELDSVPNSSTSSHRKANITSKPKHINRSNSTSSALADPWSYQKEPSNAVAKVTQSEHHDQPDQSEQSEQSEQSTGLEPIGQHLSTREQNQIDDFRDPAEQHELDEFSRPAQAWIEAKATFMGYVYSPAMQVIHWLDRLVAKVEGWFTNLASKVWQSLKALVGKS